MTSELRPSDIISEFVSGAPKNYAYRVLKGEGREKSVCKVRGISLNYNASKMVHFKVMRDMNLKAKMGDEPSALNGHADKKIERKRAGCATEAIVTLSEGKRYRISVLRDGD